MFPDGRRVVSGSTDKTLKVWDVATGECVATLEGHSNSIYCVAIFSDGRRIISGSGDGNLKLWGVAPVSVDLSKPAKLRGKLNGHSGNVYCVAISPDGRRNVSGSHDKTLKVWDVATGKCVATLEGHSSRVCCGVHCTFVIMCLRCRSSALRCSRTGDASFLRRGTTPSRCGT